MRSLLLCIIRSYRHYWPERFRRTCLFRESCSEHVYRVAAAQGALAGFTALRQRIRRCRKGYSVETLGGELMVRSADGGLIPEAEASSSILAPYWDIAKRLEHTLNRAKGTKVDNLRLVR